MIGVYGGTFDPVHFGHLRTAIEVKEQLGLQEIRLVPCRKPPHRPQPVADPNLRLQLLELATENEPGLVVDARELQRPGPSYTVDTLASMREEIGISALALIVGMDAFAGIPAWHQWEVLFDLANIVVMHRPGYIPKIPPEIAKVGRSVGITELLSAQHGCLYFQEVIQMDISASMIRRLIEQGRSVRYLLPDAVLQLIKRRGLYCSSDNISD